MSELAKIQMAFASDLRSGGEKAFSDAPGMSIYRELFFNNICGFIDGAFPVCAEIVGGEHWTRLSREFFQTHQCETPLFLKISEEFLDFLAKRPELYLNHPYLYELAHYEWLELAVDVMECSETNTNYDEKADVIDGIPVINPALMTACYQYPVHRLSAESTDIDKEFSGFIVFRDLGDTVRFVACNPMTLAILECLQSDSSITGRDAILMVLSKMGMADSAVALDGGVAILNSWHAQGILLGAAKR